IKSDRVRASVLSGIACKQAAGFRSMSLESCQRILVSRDYHLTEIARIFADIGDREGFKAIMSPSSFYLRAAYRMCGLLAKLYPEQAVEIVQFVNQTTRKQS